MDYWTILVILPSRHPRGLCELSFLTSTNADCNSATDSDRASPGIRVKDTVANHDHHEVVLNLADIKTAHQPDF